MAPSVAVDAVSEPKSFYYSRDLRLKYQVLDAKPQAMLPSSPLPPYHAGYHAGYHPDLLKYLANAAASTQSQTKRVELPSGWPKRMTGPLVWTQASFENTDQFIHELSISDKSEIKDALTAFKKLNLTPEHASQDTFPLFSLGEKLRSMRERVYEGIGVAVLRGLDIDAYTDEEVATIYLGLSSYIAERRGKQDQRGTMLSHILSNYQGEHNDDKWKNEMPFHTDVACDTLALLVRNCAAKGGQSTFASAWTVYNELADKRPDLISVLADPNWPLDTFGRDPSYHNQALLYHSDGKIILSASRRLLTGSPETPRTQDIPRLTEKQSVALDAVHFIAKANSAKLKIEKGDIYFMNNMGIIHSREAFEDDQFFQRHLLRLWLSSEKFLWKLPPPLELAWARVFDDEERDSVWDWEPIRVDGRLRNPGASCD